MTKHQRRADGRVEAYDVAPSTTRPLHCAKCDLLKGGSPARGPGQIFLVGPAYSAQVLDLDGPTTYNAGTVLVCLDHLPDDVVLVNPFAGFECRDKTGKTWQESDPSVYADPDLKLAADPT